MDALKSIADSLPVANTGIVIAYLEVYGAKVTAASSQYTAKQSVGLRLFDVAVLLSRLQLLARNLSFGQVIKFFTIKNANKQ